MKRLVGIEYFQCEQCAGQLRFDPNELDMRCEQCGRREPIEASLDEWEVKTHSVDSSALTSEEIATQQVQILHCNGCGADTDLLYYDHALTCPFCSASIVPAALKRELQSPDGFVPIKKKRQQVVKALYAEYQIEVGSDLARKIDRINYGYFPFWAFSGEVKTEYDGERGFKCDGRISWSGAYGEVRTHLEDFPIAGSDIFPSFSYENIGQWDFSEMLAYRPEFVTGVVSEAYTIDLKDAWEHLKSSYRSTVNKAIARDIGGEFQKIHNIHSQVFDERYLLVLLPLYYVSHHENGEFRYVLVNGQSGAINSNLPKKRSRFDYVLVIVVVFLVLLGFLTTNLF